MIKSFKHIISLFISFYLTFWNFSCSNKETKPVDKEKFSMVLAEITIIQNYALPDSLKLLKMDSVFKANDIHPAAFQATRQEHMNDVDFWIEVYQNAEIILKEKRNKKKPEKILE